MSDTVRAAMRERGAELVARVRERQPLVVALARVLSLAANVEVALVRRIRRVHVRQADVRIEADLWASPLVEVRGSAELRLRSDVQQALWDELAADRGALERAWAILMANRTYVRPLLALEEHLTYLALKDDTAAIEHELSHVIGAMLKDGRRRRDLAAWSARALARLPAAVRASEAARVLATAARSWVATPVQVAELTPTPEGARLAMRLMQAGPRIRVCLRRVGDVLEVGGEAVEPCVMIEMPASSPSLILDEDRVVPIDPRSRLQIVVARSDVMIGTLDGRRWLLSATPPRPNLAAVGVCQSGGRTSVAYLIAPSLAATSARRFSVNGDGSVALRFASGSFGARLVAIDPDEDIVLLQLMHDVSIAPLELEPGPRGGESCQIYPLPVRVLSDLAEDSTWDWGEPWHGILVSDSTFRGSVVERNDEAVLPGMPVFVGGLRMVGHVRDDPPHGVLRVATARAIARWRHVRTQGESFEEYTRPTGVPLVVRLPERVALDGLLGMRIVKDGPVQRLHGHVWGEHDVTVVYGDERGPGDRGAITAEISLFDGSIDDAELRVSVRDSSGQIIGQGLFDACSQAILRFDRGSEVQVHRDRRGRPDLDIRIRRLPGLSPTFACRRGVRFLLDVLAALTGHPEAPRLIARARGIGQHDVADLQRRLNRRAIRVDVLSIDPDADLVDIRVRLGDPNAFESAIDLLGLELADGGWPVSRYEQDAKFGGLPLRRGRELGVYRGETHVRAEVYSTVERPLRGYVTFYAQSSVMEFGVRRVRATGGVASCDLTTIDAPCSVGAIVEDEGLPLEAQVAQSWRHSVVRIRCWDGRSKTGFVVGAGLVLTTAHVVDGPKTAMTDARWFKVSMEGEPEALRTTVVIGSDENDWSLLRIDPEFSVNSLVLDKYVAEPETGFACAGFPRINEGRRVMFTGTLSSSAGGLIAGPERVEWMDGMSGAPCLVNGVVVGMVVAYKAAEAPGGGVDLRIVPMELVVESSQGMLSLRKAVPRGAL